MFPVSWLKEKKKNPLLHPHSTHTRNTPESKKDSKDGEGRHSQAL